MLRCRQTYGECSHVSLSAHFIACRRGSDRVCNIARNIPIDEFTWRARKEAVSDTAGTTHAIPHVVAWNLTKRCNLACDHCYIAAGPWHPTDDDLRLEEIQRITDEILDINPGPMFVLTGGEPLLRRDLEQIADYGASRGATVVVGTLGFRHKALDSGAALPGTPSQLDGWAWMGIWPGPCLMGVVS